MKWLDRILTVNVFVAPIATAWIVYEFQAAALVVAALVIGYVEGRVGWR